MQQKVSHFLAGLANRKDEVKRRCRTLLQSSQPDSQRPENVDSTLAPV